MAVTCPIGLDQSKLREEIRSIYARVADQPNGDFHFHRGPDYAARLLGYDRELLDALPPECSASFAGVANPHKLGPIEEGEVVIDIGCGAGMDLLLAARSAGARGRAIGIDMTEAMAETARRSARSAGLDNVEVRLGDAMAIPVDDGTADVVISNGVLNLTTDKLVAYGEALRVLRPGGRFLYADIVVGSELSESARSDIELWTG
jgi:arsenite methyltransferase